MVYIRILNVNIFGRNPRNGGIPAIDISKIDIGKVDDGCECFHEKIFLWECVWFIIINRINDTEIKM